MTQFVSFDDFIVTHVKKVEVKQINHYYPFGMTMTGAVNAASTTNYGNEFMQNNLKYNAGSELQELSNLYDTYYRQYDAALGRFNAIDPMASKYSSVTPYNYAFSDPVSLNDRYLKHRFRSFQGGGKQKEVWFSRV